MIRHTLLPWFSCAITFCCQHRPNIDSRFGCSAFGATQCLRVMLSFDFLHFCPPCRSQSNARGTTAFCLLLCPPVNTIIQWMMRALVNCLGGFLLALNVLIHAVVWVLLDIFVPSLWLFAAGSAPSSEKSPALIHTSAACSPVIALAQSDEESGRGWW